MADYGGKRGQVALLLQLSMLASELFKMDIPLQIFVRRTNLAFLFIDSPKISVLLFFRFAEIRSATRQCQTDRWSNFF